MFQNLHGNRRLLASIALGWLVLACFAHAQDVTPPAEDTLPDVETDKGDRVTELDRIVVGTGVDKVAINTPQAVSVIDAEDLDRSQPATIGDMLARTPGAHATGSDSLLGQGINIRGIGAPESSSDQNRIQINVDGVPKFYESYRMGSIFLEPELMKRVEVLRGPASSTLYGSGLIGGVVSFATRDPSDFLAEGKDWGGKIGANWSSNGDGLMGSTMLAARINPDHEVLLAVTGRRQAAMIDGSGLEIGADRLVSGALLAKSVNHLGDAGEQTLTISYQDWISDVDDQTFAQTSATSGFGTIDRQVRDRTVSILWEDPQSDNDWLDLKARLSFSRTENRQSDARQPSGEPWDPVLVPLFQDATYAYETVTLDTSNTIDASGDTWENHLTTGLVLSRQIRSVDAAEQLDFHPGGEDLRVGLYAQNEILWNDRLTVTPGIRADFRELVPGAGLSGLPTQAEMALSPKLAVHYRLNDHLGLFGSIARTERLPSLDEVYSAWYPGYPTDLTPAYGLGLETERALTREIGVALSGDGLLLDDDTASLKATAFTNAINDLIQRDGFGANSGFTNIGRARIDGLEIETAWASEHYFAQAAYSLVRGRDLTHGGWLNSVAPDELGLTIGTRLPERDLAFGWTARFAAAQDRLAVSETARPATPGFAVHGLFAEWTPSQGDFKGLAARLSLENLFDKDYRDFLSDDRAPGRTIKIALSQSF